MNKTLCLAIFFQLVSCNSQKNHADGAAATNTAPIETTDAGLFLNSLVVFTDLDRTMLNGDMMRGKFLQDIGYSPAHSWPRPHPVGPGYEVKEGTDGSLVLSALKGTAIGPAVPASFINMLRRAYATDPEMHFVVVTQNMDGEGAEMLAREALRVAGLPTSTALTVKYRVTGEEYDKTDFMLEYLHSKRILTAENPDFSDAIMHGRALFFDDQERNILSANLLSQIASESATFPPRMRAIQVDPAFPQIAFGAGEALMLPPASVLPPAAVKPPTLPTLTTLSTLSSHPLRDDPDVPASRETKATKEGWFSRIFGTSGKKSAAAASRTTAGVADPTNCCAGCCSLSRRPMQTGQTRR